MVEYEVQGYGRVEPGPTRRRSAPVLRSKCLLLKGLRRALRCLTIFLFDHLPVETIAEADLRFGAKAKLITKANVYTLAQTCQVTCHKALFDLTGWSFRQWL